MDRGKQVFFPPFTFDTSNQHLQRGSEKISLRPKTLAVLAYLLEHPHRLVSKEELMSAAWPKARVVDASSPSQHSRDPQSSGRRRHSSQVHRNGGQEGLPVYCAGKP